MEHKVKHVVVVGGGSAGWLTAGIIAAEHKSKHDMGVRVTLIESPEVRTIGVGEGTWPSMRSTLERIGISETEFVIECNASFKQGSKFVGWRTG
ncbi:MAG: tryptophan 7-halogenase, partial [Sphingobacteriales bacterium]